MQVIQHNTDGQPGRRPRTTSGHGVGQATVRDLIIVFVLAALVLAADRVVSDAPESRVPDVTSTTAASAPSPAAAPTIDVSFFDDRAGLEVTLIDGSGLVVDSAVIDAPGQLLLTAAQTGAHRVLVAWSTGVSIDGDVGMSAQTLDSSHPQIIESGQQVRVTIAAPTSGS